MTLRELLEALSALPKSAIDAPVSLNTDFESWDVGDVRYEHGEVVIQADEDSEADEDVSSDED